MTNNSLNDPAPALTVDAIISQFSERLIGEFSAEINHDSRSVTVAQIPEEHKAELDQLLGDQGYEVSYK